MENALLKDKIISILTKARSVEDMVMDRDTLEDIFEVVEILKKKSEPEDKAQEEKLTLHKNGQWSLDKAFVQKPKKEAPTLDYSKMNTPEPKKEAPKLDYMEFNNPRDGVKEREAKAPTLRYNSSNASEAPVRIPGANENKIKAPLSPKEKTVVPAANPHSALNTIRDRQTAQTTEPPRATPKKYR